jgi:CheY-like chemotaxis protein
MTRTPLLTGLHVVLVEDDADAREGLALILQGRGARVTAVGSAGDAFTAVSRDRPDVLVADIAMPDEDGYGLIRKVRSLGREGGGRVPAIAVSGYATPQDRAHALLEGFDMHLAKPLHVPELVVGISTLARSREP